MQAEDSAADFGLEQIVGAEPKTQFGGAMAEEIVEKKPFCGSVHVAFESWVTALGVMRHRAW
jgi:hypothetical protein